MTRAIPKLQPGLFDELVVDNFAGGGGASLGIEMGLGRAVDIAINHDADAVAVHSVNHPFTRHYCEDVWAVDPDAVCAGRPVGLAWFSPDCKHFSKAKGGKPVSRKIRGLAWIVIKWIRKRSPRVIMLENVEEFQEWGPLVPVCADAYGNHKRDAAGNIILRPCAINKGATFYRWVRSIERLGYKVEWKELRACDYGAPTIRKRMFLVARRDGMPIVWPEPTHGDPNSKEVLSGKRQPWRTAADCIDWSVPCPSIFDRKKPLADATLRRIAKGIKRYVIDSPEPFIVTYYGDKCGEFRGQSVGDPLATQTTENRHALVQPYIVPLTHQGERKCHNINDPLPTVTAAHRGELALVAPVFTECANASSPRCMSAEEPLRTICANTKGGHHALVEAFLAKHYGGVVGSDLGKPIGTVTSVDHHSFVTASMIRHFGESVGSGADEPVGTITAGGMGKTGLVTANLIRNFGSSAGWDINRPAGTSTAKQKDALVTSHMVKLRGTCRDGQAVSAPMPTVTASGTHVGEVRAFLLKYYGSDQAPEMLEPLHTVTTKDRFGLVTVRGEQYQIVDIGLRMLSPRELFRAQGFPDEYVIDPVVNGKPLSKTAQVRMCGNSVSPYPAAALVRANVRIMSGATRMGAA